MSDRPTVNPAPQLATEATRIGASQSGHAEQVLSKASVAGAGRFAWMAIALLTLTNTLNHLDRQIIGILAEPIKHEFGLNDGQLGLLTGLAFAALYGLASLPMAWIADRGNRPLLISICVAAWSLFTALGAAVQTFTQLVLARVAVGVAEAGGNAPAQSLIADMTPPAQRGRALAIFQVGIPLGGFFGLALGGVLLDNWSWRVAFLVAGLPGLVLAPIVLLAIIPRLAFHAHASGRAERPRRLGRQPCRADAWLRRSARQPAGSR
jgi:MFS family permease